MAVPFALMDCLRFTTGLAKEVGQLLRGKLGATAYQLKSSHQDLVTEADRLAEKLILDRIRKEYPDHGILSEESPEFSSKSSFRWVIDPVDGTANFAHRIPFFCTSIALEREGQVVLGVIYDPVRDELFSASAGGGAYLNEEPICVTKTDKLRQSMLSVGYPYREELIDEYLKKMKRFFATAQGFRRLGSAALCLAYVAAGRLDGYWDLRLNRWDMAAGVALIAEAGGGITDFGGDALTLETEAIVASNGKIHREILSLLGV